MLIWRKGVRLLVLGTTSATIVACETAPSAAAPVPLEVWRGGDDGLTLRFADALEASFRRFPAFVLSSGKRPGTLVETIPSNVGWKQVGSRTKVIYSVEFTGTAAQPLGRSEGSCWEDQLRVCAAQVVKAAVPVAARLHE